LQGTTQSPYAKQTRREFQSTFPLQGTTTAKR